MLSSLKEKILNILFPPLCICCRKNLPNESERKLHLCRKCKQDIKIHNYPTCPNCRKPLKSKNHKCNKDRVLLSVSPYSNEKIKKTIQALKYEKLTSALIPIRLLIKNYLNQIDLEIMKKGILAPIPLHKSKKKKRGFNQAKLIAELIQEELNSKNINLPIREILEKPKRTKPQADLNYHQRTQNLRGSFQTKEASLDPGKGIILVDDVCTTGSTLKEATKTLEKAGYKRIVWFTVANTNN